jgi:hypothetical protein
LPTPPERGQDPPIPIDALLAGIRGQGDHDGPTSRADAMTTERLFDLNIDRFLEHWGPAEAVRELIANALDEQVLSATEDVRVAPTGTRTWVIRDYGRGIRPEHLTQNESAEKKRAARARQLLGRFGVGLKDALATLERHGIGVTLRSRHADIGLVRRDKHGFSGIPTLHAEVKPPSDETMAGTEIVLDGIDAGAVEAARHYFLRFSETESLESTQYGDVLRRHGVGLACIYVRGLRVAEEAGFLFSYNITNPTAAMLKALNRERANVGRTTYADRIKAILLETSEPAVAAPLARELSRIDEGRAADELQWLDVQQHAVRILSSQSGVVFVTSRELREHADLVVDAESVGHDIVVVPERLRSRLNRLMDLGGQAVRTLDVYGRERAASFTYDFVDEGSLTRSERQVWNLRDPLLALCGGRPRALKEVRLSRTLRPSLNGDRALGVWEQGVGRIVLLRRTLRSRKVFAATLLHEVAHARSSGAPDLSPEFEEALTALLGDMGSNALIGAPPLSGQPGGKSARRQRPRTRRSRTKGERTGRRRS